MSFSDRVENVHILRTSARVMGITRRWWYTAGQETIDPFLVRRESPQAPKQFAMRVRRVRWPNRTKYAGLKQVRELARHQVSVTATL